MESRGITFIMHACMNMWQKYFDTGVHPYIYCENSRFLLINNQLQIDGSIEATDDESDYGEDGRHWLKFDSVKSLLLDGSGTINGNGNSWWQNSCKVNKDLVLYPICILFNFLYVIKLLIADSLTHIWYTTWFDLFDKLMLTICMNSISICSLVGMHQL